MSNKRNRLAGSNNFNDLDFVSRADKAMEGLDPDLYEFFDDMRLGKSKKKTKTKKKKAKFAVGDTVNVKDTFGTIIYGPYQTDSGIDTYEIETEDGKIITSEDDGFSISVYIPPVEEEEKDDLL